MMNLEAIDYLGDLRHLIDRNFKSREFKTLCSDLGVQDDNLPDYGKFLRVNALIRLYAQGDRLRELVALLRQNKPRVEWPDLPYVDGATNGKHADLVHSTAPEATLQHYLDDLEILLAQHGLRSSQPWSEVQGQARRKTLITLRHLDAGRKRDLLRFLYELALVDKNGSVVDLNGADLREADLCWANLCRANLSGVNLAGADLSLANLRDAQLGGANLRGANLRSYLVGADLVGADLREADLDGARLTGANLSGANLHGANLVGADLNGANLVGTELGSTNLQEADLTEARLIWADLRGADLQDAVLRQADLSNADLTDAQVQDAQLRQARSLTDAILPNGRRIPVK